MKIGLLVLVVGAAAATYLFLQRGGVEPVRVTLEFDEQNGFRGEVPVDVAVDGGEPRRHTAMCADQGKPPVLTCRVSLEMTPGQHKVKVRTGNGTQWSPWSGEFTVDVAAPR